MTIELSLITGSLNRAASLERLVQSIQKHTTTKWELIIADASEIPYKTEDERITVLEERPPLGHVAGYNQAFRAAIGDWVLWLNDDAEVCEGYDSIAIEFMRTHPQIGLGAIYYKEGTLPNLPWHVNQHLGIVYANFGILLREVGNEVGWFGNDLSMYGADNQLTFNMLLSGRGVADIPGAHIIHHAEQDHSLRQHQTDRIQASRFLHRTYSPHYSAMQQTYHRLENTKSWIRLGVNAQAPA